MLLIIEPSFWMQLGIGVLIVVIGGSTMVMVKRFIKRWDKMNSERDNKIELLHIKADCTVSGLKQMNGNTSIKFGEVYDKEFKAKVAERDIIISEN